MELDFLDRAVVARIPALVKAREPEASGRRIVSVEASTEEIDTDGDRILQKALLDSAASFIASGHLDIDHLSELGHRLNPPIPDPASYIIGRPIDVKSASGGRTFVDGEISRSLDGIDDPRKSRADDFWLSLRRNPPAVWFASIYGFPVDLDDCTKGGCLPGGPTRFLIKAIDWRSLAFTRTPKNTALKTAASIVTAKSFLADMAKALEGPPVSSILAVPQTMDDVYAAADCPGCRPQDLLGYRRHFSKCKGMPVGAADILAHAMMHRRNMDGVLKNGVLKNTDSK